MYPYEILLGMDLYSILILAGCLGAIIYLRIMSGKTGLADCAYNLTLFSGAAAIAGGYVFAVIFQAFYNYFESGIFEITKNTGATFYGGLIGGAAVFLAIYFIVGHFTCKNRENIEQFGIISDIASACIAFAHSLGRIGCLMAGCCHGKKAESGFGVINVYLGYKTVPVQLYESIFLMCLFAYFTYRILKKKTYNLSVYMIAYGIWRFFIEYFRDDDRGNSPLKILSPSQLTAVLMVVGGIALLLVMRKINMKKRKESENG